MPNGHFNTSNLNILHLRILVLVIIGHFDKGACLWRTVLPSKRRTFNDQENRTIFTKHTGYISKDRLTTWIDNIEIDFIDKVSGDVLGEQERARRGEIYSQLSRERERLVSKWFSKHINRARSPLHINT